MLFTYIYLALYFGYKILMQSWYMIRCLILSYPVLHAERCKTEEKKRGCKITYLFAFKFFHHIYSIVYCYKVLRFSSSACLFFFLLTTFKHHRRLSKTGLAVFMPQYSIKENISNLINLEQLFNLESILYLSKSTRILWDFFFPIQKYYRTCHFDICGNPDDSRNTYYITCILKRLM